jgi:hypothetical protein
MRAGSNDKRAGLEGLRKKTVLRLLPEHWGFKIDETRLPPSARLWLGWLFVEG